MKIQYWFYLIFQFTFLVESFAQCNQFIENDTVYHNMEKSYFNIFDDNKKIESLIKLNDYIKIKYSETCINYAINFRKIGNVYYNLNVLDSASYYYKLSMSLLEKENKFTKDYGLCLNNLGNVALEKLDYISSENYFDKLRKVISKTENPDKDILNSYYHHNLGKYHQEKGTNEDLIKAKKYYEDAIEFRIKIGAENLIDSQNNLANLFSTLGDYEKADSIFRLLIDESNYVNVSSAHLNSYGANLFLMGNSELAKTQFYNAVNLNMQNRNPDFLNFDVYLNLAALYATVPQKDSVNYYFVKSQNILNSTKNSIVNKEYAQKIHNQGIFLFDQALSFSKNISDFDSVAILLDSALNIRLNLEYNQMDLIESYSSLGELYKVKKQHIKAIENYKRAEKLCKEIKNIKKMPIVYIGLIKSYMDISEYDSAYYYCQEFENQKFNTKNKEEYSLFARLYLNYDDKEKSRNYLEKFEKVINQVSNNKKHIDLNNLAMGWLDYGDSEKAIKLMLEAINYLEKGNENNCLRTSNKASIYDNMGEIKSKLSDSSAALNYIKKSFQLRQKLIIGQECEGEDYVFKIAKSCFSFGDFYANSNIDSSIYYFEMAERYLSSYTTHVSYNRLIKYAELLCKKNEFAKSKKTLQQIYLNIKNEIIKILDNNELSFDYKRKKCLNELSAFETILSILCTYEEKAKVKGTEFSDLIFDISFFSKGFWLNTTVQSKSNNRKHKVQSEIERLSEIIQNQNGASIKTTENYDLYLKQLIQMKEEMVREDESIFKTNDNKIYSRLFEKLGQNELIIEYVRYNNIEYNQFEYKALLIAHCTRTKKQPLIIGRFQENEICFLDFQNPNNLKRITSLVWEPVKQFILDEGLEISTINYSPMGLLHSVPFHALITENKHTEIANKIKLDSLEKRDSPRGKTVPLKSSKTQTNDNSLKFLIEDYTLKQFFSTRDFIYSETLKINFKNAIICIGGIDYNSCEENITVSNTNSFDQLPGAFEEIREIEKILLKNKLNVETFSGKSANKNIIIAKFNNEFQNRIGIIHIATHGYSKVKSEDEKTCAKITSDYSNMSLSNCGLALTGANCTDQKNSILNGTEVAFDLDLFNTDLVVLSACETAKGAIQNYDGVYGLHRSFKIAGVKSLLVSLWKVPDLATKELMVLFYKELIINDYDQEKAFKIAQKYMCDKYRSDISKWAGFVLIR